MVTERIRTSLTVNGKRQEDLEKTWARENGAREGGRAQKWAWGRRVGQEFKQGGSPRMQGKKPKKVGGLKWEMRKEQRVELRRRRRRIGGKIRIGEREEQRRHRKSGEF